MKFRNILLAVSIITAGGLPTSCSNGIITRNEPDTPAGIPAIDSLNTDMESYGDYYNSQSTVADVVNDPVFKDFGHLLFPVDRNMPLSMTLAQVSKSNVYLWYPYIRVDKTVEILNYLHSQAAKGEPIFYNIYSPEEMAADPSKADTGIFIFHGEAGKPFAITNAGGGFAYVGAMHDSFPHSLELSKAGYTAFALIYRPDAPYSDPARAIAVIHANAEALGVSKDNYSQWGGSAEGWIIDAIRFWEANMPPPATPASPPSRQTDGKRHYFSHHFVRIISRLTHLK